MRIGRDTTNDFMMCLLSPVVMVMHLGINDQREFMLSVCVHILCIARACIVMCVFMSLRMVLFSFTSTFYVSSFALCVQANAIRC